MKISSFLFCLFILFLPGFVKGQLNQGGVPYSYTYAMVPDTLHVIRVSPPSMDVVRQEDEIAPVPYRFAVNLPVDVDIERSGKWDKAGNGASVWRITIHAPGALALTLYFDRFHLPPDGKFFVYPPSRGRLLGAFTTHNNNEANTFATALVGGDQVTLEYNAPAGTRLPQLHLSEVAYAYRGVSDFAGDRTGFGSAGECQVNVKCSEGDHWQNQIRSVARVEVKRGSSSVWCSGSLVNNTRNDGTPYLLTADHCGNLSSPQDLSQWLVYFNYQGTACPNPALEPEPMTMTGVKLVAHGGNSGSTGSDFFLARMISAIPDSFNVYFNGWSRDTVASRSGVGIHHPQGDIKKISTYTQPLIPSHWNSYLAYTHWKVVWAATANGHGTTEGGSSGSPIYDDQGLLIGTLTGGDSSCDSAHLALPDYYGMFYYHWDRNGTDSASVLKYWLDPINSNVMNCNGWALGMDGMEPGPSVTLFPNPVKDKLTMRFNKFRMNGMVQVRISDLWGKIVWDDQWSPLSETEKTIDVSTLSPGIYFLILSDGEVKKVIKIVRL